MSADKKDQGKAPYDLVPKELIEEVAKVLGFGAKKYAAHNWRKGMEHSRLIAAALRHLTSYNNGEDNDAESGLSHLAHAGCCVEFLLSYKATGTGVDDRHAKIVTPASKALTAMSVMAGDELICIDGYNDFLVTGNVYTVKYTIDDRNLIAVEGVSGSHLAFRFQKRGR